MSGEVMNLRELAQYLKQDARELDRMTARGKIPARKVAGKWRYDRPEIVHWLETRLETLTHSELTALETPIHSHIAPLDSELLVTPLISTETIQVPLRSSSQNSILRELVEAADRSGEVYQPDLIQDAVIAREQLFTTSLDCGAALPHWRRPLPRTLGASLIAYGRSYKGVPFGAARGRLTDVFFMILCRDDRIHLQVLARIARMLQNPAFLDSLRAAETADETFEIIQDAESVLIP